MTRSRRRKPSGERSSGGPAAKGAIPAGGTTSGVTGASRRNAILVAVIVAVALVGAWLALRGRSGKPATPSPPDPLAHVAPPEAYRIGNQRIREGQNYQAIPYFRRAFVDLRSDFHGVHFSLAAALRNATLQDTVRRGLAMPVTRSSFERVTMLRESLAELDRALGLAQSPAQVVQVMRAKAQLLSNWGFGWDAFGVYRTAQHMDSTGELGQRADAYLQILEHPEKWQE